MNETVGATTLPGTGYNPADHAPRAGRGWFAPIPLRITGLAIASLICGIASGRAVNLVGEFYLGELLVIQLALFLLLFGRDRTLLDVPAFGIFVQTAVLMLAGYIISDLYRDTNPAQFLRGWARAILLTLDFIALAILVSRERQSLWWFVLGMAIGEIGQLMVRGVPIMSAPAWKFGYSTPLVYLLACASMLLPVKVASVAFAALGVYNIFRDFRILGAICLLIGAVLWVRSSTPEGVKGMRLMKLLSACMIAGSVIAGALYATHDDFSRRREQSNIGREAGIIVAAKGIVESPIIGYGSWPSDPRLIDLFAEEVSEEGMRAGGYRTTVFAAHSQALQVWIEGGLLAVLFWVYYGIRLAGCAFYTALSRRPDAYTPVFLFFLAMDAWHLFMSPFSGPTRLPIAVGIAVICLCSMEQMAKRQGPVAKRRGGPAQPEAL